MKHPGLIAIDPGCSGGIAWVCSDGIVACDKIGKTSGDTIESITQLKVMFGNSIEVYMEDPPYFIGGKGKPRAFIHTMAKLQRRAGIVEGVIQAMGIRCVMVAPKRWQSFLGVGNKNDHGSKWKRHLKGIAQQRFPHLRVTDDTADALLILEYACLQGEK